MKKNYLSDISIENLIIELGLYNSVLIDTADILVVSLSDVNYTQLIISKDVQRLLEVIYGNSKVFLPCPYCEKEMIFECFDVVEKIHSNSNKHQMTKFFIPKDGILARCKNELEWDGEQTYQEYLEMWKNSSSSKILKAVSNFQIGFKCANDDQHTIIVNLQIEKSENNNILILKKVGQYPSMADLQFYAFKKYKKLLGNYYTELTKAVGLYASGIGVGAFVYLRRILETLVEEIHIECKKNIDWEEEKYKNSKFVDRITMCEKYNAFIPE